MLRLKTEQDEIENPSWAAVETTVRALDGETRSYAALHREGEYIGIAGGTNDLCLVIWERPEETSDTALRPPGDWSDEDEVGMTIAGQWSEVPMRQLLDRPTVLALLREYFDAGTRGSVAWRKEY